MQIDQNAMNFLSLEFSFIFLAIFPIYWGIANFQSAQKYFLLTISYGLYSLWDWRFSLLLLTFSCGVWLYSKYIYVIENARARQYLILFGSALILVYLGILKYFNFFRDSVHQLLGLYLDASLIPSIDFLLPIGVSFYSLNAIAYLVAVYKNERPPAKFIDFLLFMAFFPTILAGPILRPEGVLAQIESLKPRRLVEAGFALWLIFLGLFKKLVIATFLANTWIDQVFADPSAFHAADLLVAMFAYSIQIFCDFSGYTDVVTGLALLLGYRIPRNFNSPYLANNIKLFWQRWHISLSTFIRDFVYIPLGGARCGMFRMAVNILIAFGLSGLWHGSELRYVVWGLLHGLALILFNVVIRFQTRPLPLVVGRAFTFIFVSVAWVFFRSDSLELASMFLSGLWGFDAPIRFNTIVAIGSLFLFFIVSTRFSNLERYFISVFRYKRITIPAAMLTSLLMIILEFGPSGVPAFIYFKY